MTSTEFIFSGLLTFVFSEDNNSIGFNPVLYYQSDNDKDYLGGIQEKNGDEKLYDSFFDEEKLNFQPEES